MIFIGVVTFLSRIVIKIQTKCKSLLPFPLHENMSGLYIYSTKIMSLKMETIKNAFIRIQSQ